MTRPAVDWQAVERDYRAGILSLREMAAAHKVSHVSIKKHADKHAWTRDLAGKIQARAEALVNNQVANGAANANSAASEREIIEANAARIAQVRGEHRSDINRIRALSLSLLAELEGQGANLGDLEQLADLMRREDKAGQDKANDLYRKIISTPGRIDGAKKVAETLKIAIGLEREAYGLTTDDGDAKSNGGAQIVIVPAKDPS